MEEYFLISLIFFGIIFFALFCIALYAIHLELIKIAKELKTGNELFDKSLKERDESF